jgi:6-pyruvoyl-tetrahydropterin synthase
VLNLEYNYKSCIQNSEKVSWRISDVLPENATLDYSKKFLPEALSGDRALSFLSPSERLALNQIRGNSYLYLFRFVEEYIIAMVIQHIDAEVFGDEDILRALLRFAEEETKHQQLFAKFGELFTHSFGVPVGVAGNPEEVAGFIMQKSSMAVLVMTLHIELFTQHHYTASVRDNEAEGLDPLFKSMLKYHWLEESQHARIDALELDRLANDSTAAMRLKAVDEYIEILHAFDGLLLGQVQLDIESLRAKTGRVLNSDEREKFIKAQHRSYRYVFLVLGLTNPTFAKYLAAFCPESAPKVSATIANFS